jgi:hypothetical protein
MCLYELSFNQKLEILQISIGSVDVKRCLLVKRQKLVASKRLELAKLFYTAHKDFNAHAQGGLVEVKLRMMMGIVKS